MPEWARSSKKEWNLSAEQRRLLSRNDTLNSVLYGMCRAYCGHDDRAAIRAKVVIIGRAYASGLERHVTSIEQVTGELHTARSWLDAELDILRRFEDHEPTAGRIMAVASTHARLQRVLGNVTRNANGLRSFSSKYLHFHAPVVPIFDRYAASALRDWYRWPPRPAIERMPRYVDETYWRHLVRAAFVVDEWRRTGYGTPTARAIDSYALAWWESS